MALHPVNPEIVLRELDKRMTGHGNGERAARELGVDSAHLRAMKSGYQAISAKVAAGLGFELRWIRTVEERKAMSNQSKQRRRLIVERLRREGREAYEAGKTRFSCPYEYMDKFQWLRGYDDAEDERLALQAEN